MDDIRVTELAAGLDHVRARVAAAASSAGRDPDEVTLVVVTKTWPVSDLRLLHGLGVTDIGENRHQEAEAKATELADLAITWHFVGQVQSNKAVRIAGYADVVHSVDSTKVAQRLNVGAHQHAREIRCLIQVSLDPASARTGRGGVAPDDVEDLARTIEGAGGLVLGGVMGVPPLGADPRAPYDRLRDVADRLRRIYPGADMISAGMSGDFEAAIEAGATHVRVGSAVLGERPPLG